MKDLFLLSGLGADKRVFNFLDFGEHNVHHIEWISPLANESLQQYASRLTQQIHSASPILIGVSFGGMMAMEIGKIIKTQKIILISSAHTKRDIPLRFRVTGKLRLHRTVPDSIKSKNNAVISWLFGARNEKEKELLSAILESTDIRFLNWAVDKLVQWNNLDELQNVTRIHGTKDKILPFREAEFVVEGGEHLMVVNRSEEISLIIRRVLSD